MPMFRFSESVQQLMMLFCGQEWEEKRRQNIEKMNEEMERIAEYERGQRVRPCHVSVVQRLHESLYCYVLCLDERRVFQSKT